jgi:transposase
MSPLFDPFWGNQRVVAVDKRQAHNLPPLEMLVTENQAETLLCPQCVQMIQGSFPEEEVSPVQYGTRA